MPKPFDQVRPQLERQYLDAKYDPTSGLSKEELTDAFAHHRAETPGEPRIMTRAWLFRLLCAKARLAVEPDDYFVDKLEPNGLLDSLRWEWWQEGHAKTFSQDPPSIPGAFRSGLDLSHTCPDWRNLLQLGFTGLRDRATARPDVFHQAVAMVYDAAITVCGRFAAAQPNSPAAALAERPPQTFHEALQLAYLYHELQELEGEQVRTMGRFDLLYHDFYVNDLKSGRLTREQAKELLKYFWIKFHAKTQGKAAGKNFLFGPDVNELSYLCVETYKEMRTVDPKLSLRLASRTPNDFLDKVAACVLSGCTGIVVANDSRQIEMLRQNGKTPEDAEDYVLVGCYEPAVMGKEMCCSAAASILNLAKPVELILQTGGHASFPELLAAYFKTLDSAFAMTAENTRRWERLWPEINPSPLLSGSMDACLAKGLDVSEAGAQYNTTGCVCVGIANAADSLAAIKQLVYEERRCAPAELQAALAANWKGCEELRMTAMHRVPKWGNNDARVDDIACQIVAFLGARINHEPNARGGVFQAALYSLTLFAREFGSQTGALPDGRLAGETFALNTGATAGMDRNGVTSLINSVTKLDLGQFPSGTVLDIMLHPSVVSGAGGVQTLRAIIRSHMAQGGMAIQFNIFDADVLRDAKLRPDKYANLQVRVCGWNARFVDLTPDEQELFIAKAEVA